MRTTRRRIAGALLLPLLALVVTGCTDSDDETASTGDDAAETAPETTARPDDAPETCVEADAVDPPAEGDDAPAPEEAAAEFTFRPLDAGGPLTKAALESGDIDVGLLFSSDGAIVANDWVALEDDQDLQPADNFVPAIRNDACTDEVTAVLDALSAELTVEDMQEMVAAVSIDGDNPDAVAEAFLAEKELPGDLTAEGSITVGSSNFAESNIAAQLYGQVLAAAGVDVEYKADIGARDVYFTALESGEIDLVPEFTGTLLAFLDGEAEPSPDLDVTLAALRTVAADRGISILEPAEADSVNTFVVTGETAEELDLTTVSDLAGVDEELTLGGPPECPERPYCLIGLEESYGLRFAS
ncbi:glycine betaine ABC transporter substrate-binding protein [Iamia sp.]|uniref:glycine betaine ABC transporter substrate-binding protein n=1 Tax=Iamia sp. TaxID=2722710 RepID=UPI002C36CE1F|nr:glycine betaine ABC transporter substrate-binding protein [Iamia sp.]HXH56649.1 glycine betaine ABC transporter substrate-binding protein [Iamia sp.]